MSRRQIFGPYELAERIGVGALGEVYRAIARADGRVVALKRVLVSSSDEAEVLDTLEHEASLARLLDHPSIAKVADMGAVDGTHFIAYEFVPGRDLRAVQERALRGDGRSAPSRVPLDVAVHVGIRVADALVHAHTRSDATGQPLGLVHRDVSPPNIMVAFDGAVKLLDFGIARAAGRTARTGAGQIKGTLGYMSPEQVAGGAVDARSDVYSLAVCLWELATARRLFDGTRTLEVAQRIAKGEVPSARRVAPRVGERLDRALSKALAHSPDQRYPTALAFRDELEELAREEDIFANPTRVAHYVRSLFPEVAAEGAASSVEESLNMAENKGGSDLDVFEGLAKKSQRPSSLPGLAPPPASTANPRKATLVGGLNAALPPPSMPSMPAAPPPTPSKPPVPPPPMSSRAPGSLPPPSKAPAPIPPPATTRGTGLPPLPIAPPSGRPSAVPKTPLPPPPTITPLPPPPPTSTSALPAPLPPPPKQQPNGPAVKTLASASAVDMDWDDEEESTHVYDKDGQPSAAQSGGPRPAAGMPAAPKVSAAAALLASSGGAAPYAKVIPSAPPPPPPIPGLPPLNAPRDLRGDEATAVRPRPVTPVAGGGRLGVVLGGLSLAVVVVLAIFMFLPKKGQFKIDIKTKSGESIPKAEIYVDGQKRCDATPCVVTELDPGPKAIKVVAPGLPPVDRSETVEAGKEKIVLLEVESPAGATPSSGGSTAVAGPADPNSSELKIAANSNQTSLKVFVDGNDKGPLPLELKGLTPGEHKIRYEGGERYEKREDTVQATAGKTIDLPSPKLKVLKAQVTLDLQTKGADVKLVRKDGGKKVEKKLPDSLWSNPPVRMEINPSENWKLIATKKGFDDFSQELNFDDGQAEKTIAINLSESGKGAPAAALGAGPGPSHGPTEKPEKAESKPAGEAGQGTLNMNSIPVSKVVLDGKPMGSTPKLGVSVSAGSHSVTFISPDQGKKSVSVTVKAGETKTAAVRF